MNHQRHFSLCVTGRKTEWSIGKIPPNTPSQLRSVSSQILQITLNRFSIEIQPSNVWVTCVDPKKISIWDSFGTGLTIQESIWCVAERRKKAHGRTHMRSTPGPHTHPLPNSIRILRARMSWYGVFFWSHKHNLLTFGRANTTQLTRRESFPRELFSRQNVYT